MRRICGVLNLSTESGGDEAWRIEGENRDAAFAVGPYDVVRWLGEGYEKRRQT